MARLRFRYYMRLSFNENVKEHHFTLKCIPRSGDYQKITELHREIYPNTFISNGEDSFGNLLIYGYEASEHTCFFFDVNGVAETGKPKEEMFPKIHTGDHEPAVFYKYQTDYTRPGVRLAAYSEQMDQKKESKEEQNQIAFAEQYYGLKLDDAGRYAICICHRLGKDFQYKSGITMIDTTAEEAFSKGKGVCQDYAHIMISLCRIKKIPCRYVTGMLMGEGASHAWIEVYTNGIWLPIDPTHRIVVTDQHIKIAHGRDYNDTIVNQGMFTGRVEQEQEITVIVEQLVQDGE